MEDKYKQDLRQILNTFGEWGSDNESISNVFKKHFKDSSKVFDNIIEGIDKEVAQVGTGSNETDKLALYNKHITHNLMQAFGDVYEDLAEVYNASTQKKSASLSPEVHKQFETALNAALKEYNVAKTNYEEYAKQPKNLANLFKEAEHNIAPLEKSPQQVPKPLPPIPQGVQKQAPKPLSPVPEKTQKKAPKPLPPVPEKTQKQPPKPLPHVPEKTQEQTINPELSKSTVKDNKISSQSILEVVKNRLSKIEDIARENDRDIRKEVDKRGEKINNKITDIRYARNNEVRKDALKDIVIETATGAKNITKTVVNANLAVTKEMGIGSVKVGKVIGKDVIAQAKAIGKDLKSKLENAKERVADSKVGKDVGKAKNAVKNAIKGRFS